MSAFSTILLTLVTTMLINNVVLSQFMGLCPFLGVSKQIKTALGMGRLSSLSSRHPRLSRRFFTAMSCSGMI